MVLRESTADRVANLKHLDPVVLGAFRFRGGSKGGVGDSPSAGVLPVIEEIAGDDQGFALVQTALALSAQRC